jgi:Protein of unknown function (DUF1153)
MPGSHNKNTHAAAVPPAESPILETLPPPDTERWVARRKAQVVAAVQAGRLSLDEAMARYRLTLEEFTSWQRALYRHGLYGLQVTHSQICRLADLRRQRGPSRSARRLGRQGGGRD